ncbi:MAG: hypothetical protein PHE27_00635 [Alphaproteobacteria bacterium]|nr:hypothetical protein [Alphaproteobacteria bacterium]
MSVMERIRSDIEAQTKDYDLVVLICGAGHKNFGDELILSKWLDFYSDKKIFLVCGPAPRLEGHVCVVGHEILEQLDPAMTARIEAQAARYKNVLVHLAGGGYCNDKFHTAPKVFAFLKRMGERADIIGSGVSFYPLEEASRELLNEIDFKAISFRDAFSGALYKKPNACVGGDDLLSVFGKMSAPSKEGKNLYINVQNQFGIVGRLPAIAKRIAQYARDGRFDNVYLCELCPGDMDIESCLDIEGFKIVTREAMLAGAVVPSKNDFFIGTRFHFRMMMENSGARGVIILADDYYKNKHEVGSPSCNFVPGRSAVVSLTEFLYCPRWIVKNLYRFSAVSKACAALLVAASALKHSLMRVLRLF